MWNTFKYTLLSLMREKSLVFWSLAFPLLLGSMFYAMFFNIDASHTFKAIDVAIIENSEYREEKAFSELIDALSKPGENQLLVPHFVADEAGALQLLEEKTVVGYLNVTDDNTPQLHVSTESDIGGIDAINQTILKNVLSSYLHKQATIETLMKENPTALMDQSFMRNLYEQTTYTKEIALTANTTSGSVRYFYALLGFSSIMTALVGMAAVTRTQANLSVLGARRAVGGTSRTKTLTATILAAWFISLSSLFIAYCYLHFVLGINFGRDVACLLGLLVASFMTTGLGAFVGTIPKLGEGSKSGILTGLSCLMSLFAGLYGEATMHLADSLARNAPLVQLLNPARQVTDLFYSLYYYDTYEQFFIVVLTLLIIGTALFIGAAIFMRRQRYASL